MNYKLIENPVTIILIVIMLCSFNQKKEEVLKVTKTNLIGAYGGDEETENAYFGIFEDSVYYPDSDIWAKYELKGDTIILTEDDDSIEKLLILKFTTDSLIMNNLQLDIILHLNRRNK